MRFRHWLFLAFLVCILVDVATPALALESSSSQSAVGGQAGKDTGEERSEAAEPKNRGFYVGFSFGYSDDQGLDDNGDTFKIFGGYRFNKFIALEGALVGLGDDLGSNNDLSKDGLSVQAVGIWPVAKRVELLGKAGFFTWEEWQVNKNQFDCSDFGTGFVCTQDQDKINDGTNGTYGLGLNYHISKRWSLRAEWERFLDVGEGDVDMISLGSFYRF
jgi:opacity protein-like surface antigen